MILAMRNAEEWSGECLLAQGAGLEAIADIRSCTEPDSLTQLIGINPEQLLDVCRAALSSSECEDTHRNVSPPATQKVFLWDKTDKYHHAKVPQQDKWNNGIQVLVPPRVLTSCTVCINHLPAWVVCVHAFLDEGWHNPHLIFYAVVKYC